MRNYMKKTLKNTEFESFEEVIETPEDICGKVKKRRFITSLLALLFGLPIVAVLSLQKEFKEVSVADKSNVAMLTNPIAATSIKKGVISIPSGVVKANPFVPYRDISGLPATVDVPSFTLVEPPEVLNENSDAARVMDTMVSGILYDKHSPSAILNIEGNDYLVKKGDVVNNYKIVNILENSVTVKLGANVYKAGIGEILTEGTLNYNEVSNLSNKFGGER